MTPASRDCLLLVVRIVAWNMLSRHKAVMTFGNVYEFKKWLVKSGLVWSKTLSILLSINAESVSMPVFS